MPKLNEIIANKKDYPDEQTVNVGGEDITLGELRQGYMKDADYRQKTTTLAREREEFHRDYAAKAAALDETKRQLQAMAQSVAAKAPSDASEDDIEEEINRNPVAKRLKNQLNQMEQVLVPMAKSLVAIDKQMKDAAMAATTDFHRRALLDIVSKDKSADPAQIIEYAKNNRIPNLYTAYRDMTRDSAVEMAKEEGRRAGLEEGKLLGKKESLAPTLPLRQRPAAIKDNDGKVLNLDDAAEVAKQDMDVMGPLLGVNQ